MKNAGLWSVVALTTLIVISSCSKDLNNPFSASPRASQTLDVSISDGQTYTYNAGLSGTLIVSKQAMHYEVSQTALQQNGSIVYNYNPAAGYTGTDEVMLAYTPATAASETSGGCPSHNNSGSGSTIIAIRFNVTSSK